MRHICLLVLSVLATIVEAASVPLQDFYREVWTTRDGLSHNTVNSIQPTADGYLWFAGWEGAARFDGRQFELLRREQLNQLADSGILVLEKRANGALILGGSRGWLAEVSAGKARLLPKVNSQVNDIFEDQYTQLWVSTEGSGLFRVGTDGQVVPYSEDILRRDCS
jgi:ligand-binding sensor domain-containing protein